MEAQQELFLVAENIGASLALFEAALPEGTLQRVTDVCDQVQKAWSGSNLGYHANVYFEGLRPAPPGANFSPEWGLPDGYSLSNETDPRYQQYDPEAVKNYILTNAGNPDLDTGRSAFRRLATELPVLRRDVLSILSNVTGDEFLKDLTAEIKKISVVLQVMRVTHCSLEGSE